MAKRSLQASPAGIKAAETALTGLALTHTELETRLGISRSTISKFFNGKPVDRNLFVQICITLKLDWQEVTGQPQTDTEQDQDQEVDLDALVQAVREQIKPLIKERCGTMRVLDMTQPIALTGEQGIYTNVNILEKITGRRRLGIEELLQGCDLDEFDRFSLSGVAEERVQGVEAVERYLKLMVLGKPGAGKTTFLKYLAMQCIEGNFQTDRIPVFVTLKSFAEDEDQPNLLTCLERLMAAAHTKTSDRLPLQFNAESCQQLLQQGKLLVLLDGLDEVREEDTTRILRQIQEFSEQFYANQFVVTCRIAAKEYTFQQFTEVEVADFDDEQIRTFVENWFKCREPENAEKLTERLIAKLEEHEPIRELATNPLLLTLLCLEFEELLEFPTNRAELYERGLGILLSKWDTSRRIERDQIYKRLSLKRKENLLSQVALTTFEQKDYFFKQRTVEKYIADYISNLPDAKTDPEALLLNSEAVLKSIESQHGLLIERARGIYSFSHLTFHEYFTARNIVDNLALDTLLAHLNQKQWREVILLSAGAINNASILLSKIKKTIDQSIAFEKDIQSFLLWANQKADSISANYKSAAIRASYLEFCGLVKPSFHIVIDDCLWVISSVLSESIDCRISEEMGLQNYKESDFVQNYKEINFDNSISFLINNPSNIALSDLLMTIIEMSFIGNSRFKKEIQKLKLEIPNAEQNKSIVEEWELHDQYGWKERLRSLAVKYRDTGHKWQFTDDQKQLLQQYYDANKLLVDCLNSDCYVSREVRQEIEDTLLLPIAEIEKYKATKVSQ